MANLSKGDKIYVAGHRGLVGSAIVRSLKRAGYDNIIGRTHAELDLTDQAAVRAFFEEERPDVVVLAAAKVGGINANQSKPAEFAYENMQIQCNVIKCCHDYKVKKLLFLGSTCIYPKMAPQPIPESALLTGPLETTNEAYAIAKISGLEMCKFFKMQYELKKKDRIFAINKSYLHREMDRGAEAAGVKRIRIHDLRHSHISLLIDMGFSAVAIADRVGHESIEIT